MPDAEEQGVKSIVVLIHEGGAPAGPTGVTASYVRLRLRRRRLADRRPPILPIAQNLDPAIDVIVSGHTHQPYDCDVPDPAGNPRLVTSASSFGRLVTETAPDLRPRGPTTSSAARSRGANMIVDRGRRQDPPRRPT